MVRGAERGRAVAGGEEGEDEGRTRRQRKKGEGEKEGKTHQEGPRPKGAEGARKEGKKRRVGEGEELFRWAGGVVKSQDRT